LSCHSEGEAKSISRSFASLRMTLAMRPAQDDSI